MSETLTATGTTEYMKGIHNLPSSDPFGLDEGNAIKDLRNTGTGRLD